MILENLSIAEFFGILIFFVIQSWLIIIFFDGLGKIKDLFYHSIRKR